jgi:hypothetical protein
MDNSNRPVTEQPADRYAISDLKLNRRARRALISCARRGLTEVQTFIRASNARWQRGNER